MVYSRAKELIKKELGNEGLDPTIFGIHRLSVCQTDSSRDVEVGEVKRLGTIT